MADYLIHDSTLEDIADAIRSKTGGSSLIAPEDMPTEIASIETGGGLPTGMTNIGSGSFTFASRTGSAEQIYHGLNFTPKIVLIWTDDNSISYNDVFYSLLSNNFPDNAGTKYSQRVIVHRASSGALFNTNSGGPYITSEYFYINHGSYYYTAGSTYNWFAFA